VTKTLWKVNPLGSGLDSGRVGRIIENPATHIVPNRFLHPFDPEREVVMHCLDGGVIRMFRNRISPVKYVYIGPNGEIGVPTLPVLYFDRCIEWFRGGARIGITRHVPDGTHGMSLTRRN